MPHNPSATDPSIVVRHVADGDYVVVRGGPVYGRRRTDNSYFPYDVKAGDIATAGEICEWEEFGVRVADLTEKSA